jgi:hypothetical protein
MKTFTSILFITSFGVSISLLGGCASITSGTKQSVSVITPPTSGAMCSLSNNKGSWYINQTPGSVTVHQSYKDLNVICNKKGYRSANQKVKSKTKAMAFGNAIFGGVIGAGVDAASGAAYKYPSVITVPMKKVK